MILFTSTLDLKHFLYLDRNIWGYLFEFDHKYQKNKSVTTYSRRILDLDPVALTLSGSAYLLLLQSMIKNGCIFPSKS